MAYRLPNEERVYAVYILASRFNGTLYIGVTGDLISRIAQHKAGDVKGFTQKYKVHTLVWYENFGDVSLAISARRPEEMAPPMED